MDKTREVVVLGGNGFLGTWLCEALWLRGAKPLVLDKALGCDLATDAGQEAFKHVLNSIDSAHGIDIVMMAAQLGAEKFDTQPLEPYQENKAINEKCIDTVMKFKEETKADIHISFYSTSEVYGNVDPGNVPIHLVPTIDPTFPRALYAQEKLLTETMLNYLRNKGTIASLRVFRPFNVSGKWQKRGVLHGMVKSAIERREINYTLRQTREITFAQDATSTAVNMVLKREEGTVDLTSKNHILLRDLAFCTREALLKTGTVVGEIEVSAKPTSCSYIQTRGTSPLVSTEEGLNNFTKALLEHGIVEGIASTI